MNYEKVPVCRVLAVSDEPIRLFGIKYILKPPVQTADERIVLGFDMVPAKTINEAMFTHRKTPCDVLLLSVRGKSGMAIRLIPKLLLACPGIRILVIADLLEKDDVLAAIRIGAAGYIEWGIDHLELRDRIREIYLKTGDAVYSGTVARMMAKEPSVVYGTKPRLPCGITPRELQILQLIALENSNKQIADILNISTRTVESHRKNAYRKLNARNMAGAIGKAYELGLIKRLDSNDEPTFSLN